MESSSLVDECLSPESTVTSLLSSSGHLRSSLRPPEHDTAIRYRDKDYDSASAALDAYISDFDRSCQKCRSLTGSLVLCNGPSSPTKPRVGSLRNRDVLRERLTDRELDFLNLPVSSLRHRSNRDRYSMTTNELLSIPYDGSMPVTHTSAFVQGLPSWSEAPRSFSPTFRPAHRTSAGLDNRAAPFHLNQTSDPIRPPSSSRCRGRAAMLNPAAGASSSAHRAADLHIPHWLTSNKAELNCSEISSLPDLKYPAWIRRCDVSEPDLWDERVSPPTGAPRLQSVEAELQRQKEPADPPPFTDSLKTPEKQLVHHDSEFQSFHGPPSLQRALHHLNRLKLLLEEPSQIDREEGEEKEEDEGRYSSSSADRLVSSQQESS
uniref:Chromosome 18 open reading frame 54 n=2 Tax=Nothobranchius kuhntae TaxID=321403 RepID=A0A1A8J1R8_NOTKU